MNENLINELINFCSFKDDPEIVIEEYETNILTG